MLAFGEDSVGDMLVLTQVVLSEQLPFAIIVAANLWLMVQLFAA